MAKYTEADFHLPRPRPPTRDFRWYSLIVPPVGFSIGMVLFGLLGFSFVELRDMPALLRSNIVVLGSIGLAIGSELGTLPALLEVFRKVGAGKAGVWDWIGLGVSVLTRGALILRMFPAVPFQILPQYGHSNAAGPLFRRRIMMSVRLECRAASHLSLYLGEWHQVSPTR